MRNVKIEKGNYIYLISTGGKLCQCLVIKLLFKMTDSNNKRSNASRLCINLQGDNDEDGTVRPSPLWINPRVDGRINTDSAVDFSSWLKPNWLEEQEQFSYTRSPTPGADSTSGEETDSERYPEKQRSGRKKKELNFSTAVNVTKAANLFRSRSQAQKRQFIANNLEVQRSKTSIGVENPSNGVSRSKSVRWVDGRTQRDNMDESRGTAMISRSKSFSYDEPLSGLFDIAKAAGKRKPILVNNTPKLPSPAPYSLYLYAQTPQPPKHDKEFKVPKKKRKRLCKIILEEDETEALRPKIGDRKVSDDELDMIVSRLIRPTNASRARSASISRVFFQSQKKPPPRVRVDYLVFEPNRFRGLKKVGIDELEEITERLNTFDIERWPPNSARNEIKKSVKEEKLGVLNSYGWKGVKNC